MQKSKTCKTVYLIFILVLLSTPLFSSAASSDLHSPVEIQTTEIEPDTIRYGKETEVRISLKHNTSIKRVFLSPGGPYATNITNKQLPTIDKVTDLIIGHDRIILASSGGNVQLLNNTDKTPAIVSQTKLESPIVKLTMTQKTIFAVTQAGELYSLDSASLAIKNKIAVDGIITDMAADNNRLYLLQNQTTLLIFDVQTSSAPVLKTSHKLSWTVFNIAAGNGYCFLAAGKNGIIALNTKNTANVSSTKRFITSGIAHDIIVRKNLAYIADGPTGLTILDVSTPEKIVFVGSNNKTGNTDMISLNKDRILSGNLKNRLYQLDVSNPETPVILSTFQSQGQIKHLVYRDTSALIVTDKNIYSLNLSSEITPPINSEGVTLGGSRRGDIKGNILYVADWFSGLHIYDISKPETIRHLSGYHTKGSSKGVIVRGGYAFVGDDDHGLQIIDVKDPVRPVFVAELPTTGLAYTLKLIDDILYLADHRGGFHIIDIQNIKHPVRLGGIDTPGKAWAIDVKDDIAYVADDTTGLLIFDVSSPRTPELIGQFNPGGFAEDVKIRDNLAFVSFFDKGLYILNISIPDKPVLLGHTAIPGNARGIELDGDTAYISAWYAGLQIVDIKHPENPVIIGYYDTDGATWGTNKKDNTIFALDWWGGIKTIDIKNRLQPTLVGQYQANNIIRHLAIKGNYTYTTNGKSGLQVFDTRNPLNPMWISGLELPYESTLIAIRDNFCFITSANTLSIIDINDPFQSSLITTINVAGVISALNIVNNHVLVLDKDNKLTVFDLQTNGIPDNSHTTTMPGNKLWADGRQLVLANQKRELYFYNINTSGKTEFKYKYRLSANATQVRFYQNAIFVSTDDQTIRVLSIDGTKIKELTTIVTEDKLIDIKIDNNILYATGEHSGLMAFKITEGLTLKSENNYPSSNPVSYFQVNKDQVFFAGGKRLSTLTLLPSITSKNIDEKTLSFIVPKKMPLGKYNLVLEDRKNNTFILPNTISVELPNFGKPQFKNN